MQTASSGSNNTSSSSNSNKKCPIKTPIERIVVHLEETKTDTLEAAQKEEEQPQHKLEQDVTNVEYDIINYASPPPPPARPTSSLSSSASVTNIPRIAVTSPRPRQRSKQNSSTQSQCQAVGQRCSRLNNNSSSNHSVLVEVGATSSHSPNIGVSDESVAALTEEEHDGQTEEVERPPKILRCLDVDTSAEDQPIRSRGGGGAVHSRLRKPQATVQARSSAAATTATASVVGSNHHPNPNRHASPSPCSTLGVNMRVTGQCSQGGRKYMEDQFSVAYQESPLTHELEYAFFGIYDGHGGNEAALFAKEHLMLEIVKQKQFWSDNDEDVLRAIREGYIATHFAMWREQEKWPRTANGHLSTAGTTATVAFMRREKIYIGHVGDSGIVLGYQKKNERHWRAKQLTTDHKPESAAEKARIQRAGGNVAIKSGVPRVVWNRPRDPMHRGPIRRRTLVDDIPFLAVARSLGDLWSYNSRFKEFVVSPDPDVKVVKIDPKTFRCLIFGTDGLWNVVTPTEAVDSVRKKHLIGEILNEQDVMNPSKALVDQALKTWAAKKMRADNTSVVTVILTPATSNSSQSSNGVSEVDMDMFLEAEDQADIDEDDEMDEDERLDRENSCPVELCIEEEEYVHDTPYSALAKRHLPPEPYRNFDYYGMDEDVAEGCGEDNNNDDDDEEEEEEEPEVDDEEVANNCDGAAAIVTVAATTMEVYDGQRMQQSLAIHRKLCRRSIVPTQNPSSNTPWASVLSEERQAEKEQERAMELDAEHNISIFSDTSIDRSAIYDNASSTSSSVTSSSRVQVVRTDLDHHSFSNYVANGGTAVTTDFSFAESYNTLLNEQEQQARNRSEAAAAAAATTSATGGGNATNGGGSTGVGVDVHRMHEIIQEQQLYQQQEGYSLTQLETRSEQLQLQQHQHQQQQQEQQSNWTQPGELLELNALLQQEREEEEQVAREQMMEATSSSSRGEFGYATDWSSRNTSMQLPGKEDNDSAEEKPDQMSKERSKEHQQQKSFADPKQSHPDTPTAPTLQDNEVSSTLPATPEPTPIHASTSAAQQFQETVAEIRKEDADAVHYIFEQIQKLQQVDCTPVAAAPNVGEALERANALAGSQSVPLIRQMRRYRNVPNENHQHMQTRRRHQIFKSTKAKSFITASAAAIVAYSEREQIETREESGADNRVNPDTVVGGGTKARAGSTSVGNNNKCNENDNVTSGGSSSASVNRRRIVNVGASVSSASTSASSSTNMVMTRRSHSLINTGVNKRQLRSSICNLGNLDLTKRTLRTRNVPAAMASTTSSSSSRSPAASSSSRTNNSFVSAVANTPTTPRPAPAPTPTTPSNTATTTPANSSPSSRRLKRTKEEEREQRRSLRRTTLSASQLSARHHHQLHLPHHQLSGSSSSSSGGSGQFGRSTRLQPCSGGAISARPPPSPKKLNGAVPTLAIGTRAYTAALAAAADHLNKRWSLRSSSSSHTSAGGGGGTNSMGSSSSTSLGGNSLMSAITCYSPRNRNSSNTTTTTTTSAAAATTRRR